MDVFDVNVASTARLLEWSRAAGVRRFIYASSGGIYGQSEQEFTEDDPVGGAGPLGYYLASKQCGELLVESYADFFTVVILRFFFVYGPAQRTSMLVPRLVESVAEGRPVVLQGEDGIRLNPIEVRDAARAVEQAIRLEESQKINVAGAEILPLRRMAEVIGETLGTPPRFEVHPASGPNQLVGDIRKMTRLLTTPRVTFPEGVREICAAREARRRETDPAGGVPNQRGAVA